MNTDEILVLYDTPILEGECPLWHAQEGALYWIDIAGKAIHKHQLSNDKHIEWSLPSEPGCIALNEDGGLVVAMRSGVSLFNTTSGTLTHLIDAPYDTSKIRFNDGRCDSEGRLWVGTLYEPRDRPGATLYCLDHGDIRDVNKPVTTSNGVAFSNDFHTLYHADTRAHRITAYGYDPIQGEVVNGRLFHQFNRDKANNYIGRPDGAAVDSEGTYWCAMFEGQRILRLSPEGDILREILLPAVCPTMVAFGGEDLRTLFITTSRKNRSDEELATCPLSGCVFSMKVEAPGRLEFAYRHKR